MPRNKDAKYRSMPGKVDCNGNFVPSPIAQSCGYKVFGSSGTHKVVSLRSARDGMPRDVNVRRAGQVIVKTGSSKGKNRSLQTKKRPTPANKNSRKRIHPDYIKIVDAVTGKLMYPADYHTVAVRYVKGFRQRLFMQITHNQLVGANSPRIYWELWDRCGKILQYNMGSKEWAHERSGDDDRRKTVLNLGERYKNPKGWHKQIDECKKYLEVLEKEIKEPKVFARLQY